MAYHKDAPKFLIDDLKKRNKKPTKKELLKAFGVKTVEELIKRRPK